MAKFGLFNFFGLGSPAMTEKNGLSKSDYKSTVLKGHLIDSGSDKNQK